MTKVKENRYYGVVGVNAYGVYNDYEKVLSSKKYIGQFRTKGFKSFDKAKEWAEDIYMELQTGCIFDYKIGDIEKVNWCYYRKRVEE